MAKVNLTAGRLAKFVCPEDKATAFLWDTEVPGLGVRVTPRGAPAYVFQRQMIGKSKRVTIGAVHAWSIPEARQKAREMQREIDQGMNPAQLKAERKAAVKQADENRRSSSTTVGDAWAEYLLHGRPKRKEAFSTRYLNDLRVMSAPGGEKKKRGSGETRPGPIYPLLELPLQNLNEDVLQQWVLEQSRRGRHQAARALMMFRGFLRWCGTQSAYKGLAKEGGAAAAADSIASELPAQTRRRDAIEPHQVTAWWAAVLTLSNHVASAYLRILLLTGVRREALASLKWSDVDLRWGNATFADKVEGRRTVPLGRAVLAILQTLPRVNEYVFYGKGKSGYLREPRGSMETALKGAGLGHVTIHGIRRSFALLTEEAGVPVGGAQQLMGHRPQSVHEGYKPRGNVQLQRYLDQFDAYMGRELGIADIAATLPQTD